jgi:hypothetical protein
LSTNWGKVQFVLVLTFGTTYKVLAGEDHKTKNGFYVGAFFPYNTFVSGSFSGKIVSAPDGKIVFAPEVEGALGIGIVLGWRFKSPHAIEISYSSSNHNALWIGSTSEIEYTVWQFTYKYFFITSEQIDTYIQLGFTGPVIEIKEVPPSSPSIEVIPSKGDRYEATGLDLGIGFSYTIFGGFSINTRISYSLEDYSANASTTRGGIITQNGQVVSDTRKEYSEQYGGSCLKYDFGIAFTF